MTDRERWTVYPLLFLALGVSVKDKIVKFVEVPDVFCNKLVVTDREGREQVMITATPGGGRVQVQSSDGTEGIILSAGPQGIVRLQNGSPSYPIFAQPRRAVRGPQQIPPDQQPGAPPAEPEEGGE